MRGVLKEGGCQYVDLVRRRKGLQKQRPRARKALNMFNLPGARGKL